MINSIYVTGVVLANASMDIALHDVNYYLIEQLEIISKNDTLLLIPIYYNDEFKEYIEQFWVGLLDGDGSIVIRKNKNSKVYASFEISLKYLEDNVEMLTLISKYIGGRIYYEKKKNEIIKVKWVAVSSKDVQRCLTILCKYPLLTSNKICQLAHLKNCLLNKDWSYHLNFRDKKFDLQENIINSNNQFFIIPTYFKGWVSGFIEAEGCFRFLNNKATSFYISQNNDFYIINAMKTFFQSQHKIGIHKDYRRVATHYRISISGKPCLTLIKSHLLKYPLLGNKKISFDIWSKTI